MRAFYIADLTQGNDELLIDGEAFDHLKVVRLKIGEELLLLNGKGLSVKAKLISISKKNALVKCLESNYQQQASKFSIAIGLLKKDAFDLCLKMAVELGVKEIIPIESQYSQRYDLNFERVHRLLTQALEQSNSTWLPEISIPQKFESFVEKLDSYQNVILMGMNNSHRPSSLGTLSGTTLGLIGPEGGFSTLEEDLIAKCSNVRAIHLPTPILRAPTAFAALAGVIFTKIELLD